MEAAGESFELADGHLVEVADGGEELDVAGGDPEGPPVLPSVRGLQFLFMVFEEVGVEDEFSSSDEFLFQLVLRSNDYSTKQKISL